MKDVMALMKALRTSPRRPATPKVADFPDAWLFAAAAQPVMIVDLASGSIIEANPAAASLLGIARTQLIGTPLLNAFAADSTPALTQQMSTTRLSGYGKRVTARTRASHGGREVGVTLSVVVAESDSYLLVRLLTSTHESSESPGGEVSSIVLDVIEQAPEGFVVTDTGLRVTYANRAFIDLAGLESPEELRGKSLAVWLELSQPDLARLHDQMARREAVTVWKTMLRRSSLSVREVEVSAIAVPDGKDPCWGFRISAGQRAPLAGTV
jgi:PAS domain S-box-containing protein